MAMKKKGAAKGGVRKMKPGGRAGSKKPDNSAAKKKHTLDTHNASGKRIRSDKQAAMIPMDFSGKASSSGYDRPHKTLFEMDTGPTPNKKRVGRAGASLTKKKAGGKVAKKKSGGAVTKKMGGGKMMKKGYAKGGKLTKKMGKGGTLVRGTGAQRSGRMARGPMG